jgi:Tol biopolymer transport system component
VSLAGLAALAGVGWWRAVHSQPAAPTTALTLGLGPDLRLASPWVFPLAISPDGQTVAYIARTASGERQLFVKHAGELHGRPLPGTEGTERPVFSANGRSIAYVANGQLRVIPTEGGTSVPVPSGRAVADGWPPVGLAWAGDGTFVIAPNASSGLPPVLHVVPSGGGQPRALTRLAPGEVQQRWPIVLADGETVLYTSYQDENDPDKARIGIASLRGGAAVPLELPGVRAIGLIDGHVVYASGDEIRAARVDLRARRVIGPAVTLVEGVEVGGGGIVSTALSANGTLVYLAGNNRQQELVFVDETGARKPFSERKDYDVPRASPDGRRVGVMVDEAGGDNIWILDRAEGSITPLTTNGHGEDPEWSADGRWIYFAHYTWSASSDSIFRQPPDGSAPPSLVTVVRNLSSWALHPSGAILVFEQAQGRPLSYEAARVRRLEGDTTSRPLKGATEHQNGYRFSPDGRWLCFEASEAGTTRVYVRPFPEATPRVQVSIASGREPLWSADGRRLYYRDGQHFVAADLDFTSGPRVTRRTTLFRDEFDPWGPPPGYDVMRDGRFVLIRHSAEREEVVAIVNWDRQVRARLRERR